MRALFRFFKQYPIYTTFMAVLLCSAVYMGFQEVRLYQMKPPATVRVPIFLPKDPVQLYGSNVSIQYSDPVELTKWQELYKKKECQIRPLILVNESYAGVEIHYWLPCENRSFYSAKQFIPNPFQRENEHPPWTYNFSLEPNPTMEPGISVFTPKFDRAFTNLDFLVDFMIAFLLWIVLTSWRQSYKVNRKQEQLRPAEPERF